jgi:hypothetical protein
MKTSEQLREQFPELIKLATDAVAKQTHWDRPLAYPDYTNVYIEREADLYYNQVTKKGDIFLCISTPTISRMTNQLSFEIKDDIIYYGCSNLFNKTLLTNEIINELEQIQMTTCFFWETEPGHLYNIDYMSIEELKNVIKTILKNKINTVIVKESNYGFTRNGAIVKTEYPKL